jgi:hypothetical protein
MPRCGLALVVAVVLVAVPQLRQDHMDAHALVAERAGSVVAVQEESAVSGRASAYGATGRTAEEMAAQPSDPLIPMRASGPVQISS